MSVWDYLFDAEDAVAEEAAAVEADNEAMHAAVDSISDLRRQLADSRQQIDRLQLVCEALVSLLELRGGIERRELSLMIQRLDLSDGVEDNRVGPDRVAGAPKCSHCGRPVNPSRSQCIYCFAPTARGRRSSGGPLLTERLVDCSKCGQGVPESTVYFSEQGLVCRSCHLGPKASR